MVEGHLHEGSFLFSREGELAGCVVRVDGPPGEGVGAALVGQAGSHMGRGRTMLARETGSAEQQVWRDGERVLALVNTKEKEKHSPATS